MRLALFGGTFDPIHRGHLAIAHAAAEAFALDTILFAPTGRQPLKHTPPIASFDRRLAMASLACAADSHFTASEIDAPNSNGSPNYTVDTLTRLRAQHPEATLYTLAGLDTFLDLPRWRDPARLLNLAEWIVVNRPNHTLDPATLSLYTHAQQARIHPLLTVHEDISSTHIRARLAHRDPCPDVLPTLVAAYIATHHLYRGNAAGTRSHNPLP